MDRKQRASAKDPFAQELHWWDDHPPANPDTEPLYANMLQGHLAALA